MDGLRLGGPSIVVQGRDKIDSDRRQREGRWMVAGKMGIAPRNQERPIRSISPRHTKWKILGKTTSVSRGSDSFSPALALPDPVRGRSWAIRAHRQELSLVGGETSQRLSINEGITCRSGFDNIG
jgi:hypothetical protein